MEACTKSVLPQSNILLEPVLKLDSMRDILVQKTMGNHTHTGYYTSYM